MAYYPMNLDLLSSYKNQQRSKKKNERIEAEYLILQRINGKLLYD